MHNNKQGKIMILVGVMVFAYIILTHNLSVSNQVKDLKHEVNRLQYALNDVSDQLNTIIERDNIVAKSQYKVERVNKDDLALGNVNVEISSNKLGSYEDVMVVYRATYDFSKPGNYDYTTEEWKTVELINDKGNYTGNVIVPYSCNYEMKIAYDDNNHKNYEQLPDLDLYAKAERTFMKDINIYDVKKDKLEFDIQIAKFDKGDDVKLLRAVCNIYYGNEIIQTVDILKENEIEDRKEPRNQLEHQGGDYWFVIKEIDFADTNNFDESQVLIEIVLEDSIKNIYKKSSRVN